MKTLHKTPTFTNTMRFKIRRKGDYRPWEELEGLDLPIMRSDTAWIVARDILTSRCDLAEIRWNTIGSLQGNYLHISNPDVSLIEGR